MRGNGGKCWEGGSHGWHEECVCVCAVEGKKTPKGRHNTKEPGFDSFFFFNMLICAILVSTATERYNGSRFESCPPMQILYDHSQSLSGCSPETLDSSPSPKTCKEQFARSAGCSFKL